MIRLDMDTYDELEAIAESRGVQIAPMAREVLKDWVAGRVNEVAELRRLIEQLSVKVDQLQRQVDAHSGALDYQAQAIFYSTQSITKKNTYIRCSIIWHITLLFPTSSRSLD
ncbi:hypothetical protein [Trichormus azollae]|uniref:Uncharacterized protein n=1 Tax=Nostoc azollae (strain 0708) TaxID=551115 RepID=D7E222_NOSA0|nr:hypothetical protein [Trichormus azollae]ADI63300.1 hypothetical protein Aazo_0894 ['Nostoc azollae' 0708]